MNPITFSKTVRAGGEDYAKGVINILSQGWSGKVIRRDVVDIEDRTFVLNIDCVTRPTFSSIISDYYFTDTGHGHGGGGYVTYDAAGGVVAISLEHFGAYPDDGEVNNGGVQTLGRAADGTTIVAAWGAKATDSALTITDGSIYIEQWDYHSMFDGSEGSLSDIQIKYAAPQGTYYALDMPVKVLGNWQTDSTTTLSTDLPIFETDAALLRWIASNYEDDSEIVNKFDPYAEYEARNNCWYIHNVWGHNTEIQSEFTAYRNLQFYPKTGRIALYRRSVSPSQPYDLGLVGYSGYTVKAASAYGSDFTPYSGSVPTDYISEGMQWADNDFYSVFAFDTNIWIFGSLSEATDYINYRIDETSAENYKEQAILDNEIIPPDFGIEDQETDIGANEQVYNISGFHLYEVSHTELSSFFLEIFDPDPNITDAILNGTKLFSGNEINAIMMCMFLPITDIGDICEMGSTSKITVGTWQADHSEGKRIVKNNKVINMGEMFIPYRYNSEEDFEPYTNMYIQLPYCGTQQLQVSKYIGKTMRCDYAVSVADGSCKALLYANDILMDEFSGNIGSMRPVTASDAAQYTSNIVNGIMGGSSNIAGGAAGALKSGMEGVTAGGLVGGAGAVLSAGNVAATGVWKGYELLQAAETPPMSTSGSLSGGISYFGVQKPHIIIAQKATVRPANEKNTIGLPSGVGGKISSFSGYLKCSAVKLQNFPGTKEELAQLYNILAQGIYLS